MGEDAGHAHIKSKEDYKNLELLLMWSKPDPFDRACFAIEHTNGIFFLNTLTTNCQTYLIWLKMLQNTL